MENETNQSPESLPDFWAVPDFNEHPILSTLFRILCLISMSRPSLEHHWKSKINDDEWEKHRKSFIDRLSNTNIAAGLVLTTSAVFLSTQPPLASFLPYTLRACYILAFGSFAHALGGLLTGLAVVNIYEACDRIWTNEVLTATRFRLCCTLMFIAWPAISLTLSIIFLMSSLIIACYASGLWWIQFLATIEILSWAWLPPLFVWCALEKTLPPKLRAYRRQTGTSSPPSGICTFEEL
ncbi:uncharacterized protein F5147DRAFT_729702 [Suillus discolor]|uniref:Uncharacterized protein n=1 Tax=Suillus discolor TaxID=1912936 RepID=A0A9P7ESQ5_9AGAM|nr:uncharacterized protein F5147DRAFT_729702 [Suillus discolor]KAG2085943.1 hypothetical protein F5147DRAFT_729702 [Suillus discolor]